MRKYLYLSFLLICLSGLVFGQKGTITVIDSKTREKVPFAHVCFEELNGTNKQYVVSNNDGKVANISEKKTIVAVSCVGYKTQIDTIYANKDFTVYLAPTVFDIDQVVVTASFTPQKSDQSIYKVKVIDRKQIENKAAANLSDIMASEVNIKLSHDPVLGTGMKIKGLSGNNVKILIDGIPVVGRLGGEIDLSQLNLYNIDHIEMVDGPLSVIYGSNALAGAINIITKENHYSKFTGSINAYYETIGTYNFDGGFSSKKGKHGFSLTGGRNFFGGYGTDIQMGTGIIVGDEFQLWKPKEQYNADLYYTFTNTTYKIKYQSSYMRERLLSKGHLLPPLYYTRFDDWFYSDRFNNRIEYNQDIKSNYVMNNLFSYSFYQRVRETYSKDLYQLTQNLTGRDTTQINAFMYRLMFGNKENIRNFGFVSGIELNYEIGSGERILDNRKEIGDYAVFTSVLYNVSDKLSIQPGLRYAYNTKFNVPLVPSFNVKWDAFSFMNLRASYARGYRAPTLKELYIYFVDINHNIQPNDQLEAEWGHNFDLSLSFNTEKDIKTHFSNIELGLFYNDMNNRIYLAKREFDESNGPVYQNINISDFNTLGGQITFKYNYYPHFDFSLAIGETGSYVSLEKRKISFKDYDFSPDLGINFSGFIQKIGLRITANYKYTGVNKLYDVSENIDGKEITVSQIEDYHNMDITLARKLFSNKVNLSVGVKNLFNNTLLDVKGMGGGSTAHSSSEGSPIGYGRIFFTKVSFNLVR